MKFKIGDKVKINEKGHYTDGQIGTIKKVQGKGFKNETLYKVTVTNSDTHLYLESNLISLKEKLTKQIDKLKNQVFKVGDRVKILGSVKSTNWIVKQTIGKSGTIIEQDFSYHVQFDNGESFWYDEKHLTKVFENQGTEMSGFSVKDVLNYSSDHESCTHRRYEADSKSGGKYWEIWIEKISSSYMVCTAWGKLGSKPQQSSKGPYANWAAENRYLDLIDKKKAKDYKAVLQKAENSQKLKVQDSSTFKKPVKKEKKQQVVEEVKPKKKSRITRIEIY